jgi:branched-chain amino acid aminotransferase
MAISDRDGVIWRDGDMIPWREANTHVLTHTLHYGAGVFEGVRAYQTPSGPAIFRLEDHTQRLFNSAKIIGMKLPFTKEQISQANIDVVRENGLSSGYIRPMCFYGSQGMGLRAEGLQIHAIVAAWEWGSYMGDEKMQNGIKVKTSSFTRHHVNTTMCKAKVNGHYVNSMLALQDAIGDNYDEALLLDPQGFVAEGTGENVFIIRDGVIYTPELSSALDGITRKTIITIAGEMNIPVVEKQITRDEVYIADEAFFTGTAAEVTPICELDKRQIGKGGRGEITERLQTAYFDIVKGRNDKYADWLTPVK